MHIFRSYRKKETIAAEGRIIIDNSNRYMLIKLLFKMKNSFIYDLGNNHN